MTIAPNTQSRTFDTSTIQGLRSAEQYQNKLYNLYDRVTVTSLGFTRVIVTGTKRSN